MAYYQIFTSFIAVTFFIVVFVLIRRDSIQMGAAFRWFVIALVTLILGIYPQLSNVAAEWVGVSYPPILPITLACLLLLIKALIADIKRAKTEVKLDRVAQRLAILELNLRDQQTGK
ncbi:DUF2304 domain-containing protein [Pseudoalteromonas sp. SW0106-04]|uniref:DUF2304 domain-containing protein n=1 Tax=Pseudoalteromonas sp. SW0106-04 TaxID=1702169 RepID=UPI0006B56E91|nr:DUF2304 domain-containing protein [Pseudoalteromonas sp. SW0106-04]